MFAYTRECRTPNRVWECGSAFVLASGFLRKDIPGFGAHFRTRSDLIVLKQSVCATSFLLPIPYHRVTASRRSGHEVDMTCKVFFRHNSRERFGPNGHPPWTTTVRAEHSEVRFFLDKLDCLLVKNEPRRIVTLCLCEGEH